MRNINFNYNIAKFYTYRTAVINNGFSTYVDKQMREDICDYIVTNGHNMDNHICWQDTSGLCYMYSDHRLYIGTEVKEKNW